MTVRHQIQTFLLAMSIHMADMYIRILIMKSRSVRQLRSTIGLNK